MAKLHKFEGTWYWSVVEGGQLYFGVSTSFLDALEAILAKAILAKTNPSSAIPTFKTN